MVMPNKLEGIPLFSSWKARSAGVAIAALLAVAAVNPAVGQVNHNDHTGMSQSDCSTAKAAKIAAVEAKKTHIEKMIAALNDDIAETSRRIPLTPDGSARKHLEQWLEHDKQEQRAREREREQVQTELVAASCY